MIGRSFFSRDDDGLGFDLDVGWDLLEDRGAFHIKRAAEKISARLGVSRVTAYGYLDEVRRG